MSHLPRPRVFHIAVVLATTIGLGAPACGSTDTAVVTSEAGPLPDGARDDASSNDDSSVVTDGAKTDAPPVDGSSGDAGCSVGVVQPATGETCVGFGKKDPCGTATCGIPFGYLCFNGGPPSFNGCLRVSASAFGDTYCCPENKCVAEPDQDAMCNAVVGKPHRYQCPPDGAGGNVAPPAGCTESGSGGTDLEKFYCCP